MMRPVAGCCFRFPRSDFCAAEGEENQIRCSGMMAAGWVYPQRDARMRARAFLVPVLIVVRLLCRGREIVGLRCHVARISPAGSENRGILHGSNHWMRSFRSPSPSAHPHARTHARTQTRTTEGMQITINSDVKSPKKK